MILDEIHSLSAFCLHGYGYVFLIQAKLYIIVLSDKLYSAGGLFF